MIPRLLMYFLMQPSISRNEGAMNVLFASSEASPFFSSGGLGDTAGNLARALWRLNIDIRVILPLYRNMDSGLRERLRYVKHYFVPLSWRNQYCGLFELELNEVHYYFLDNEYYFGRDRLYGYHDDGERFAFFARAVLETLRNMAFAPQIIHCNDWHTALTPVFLNLFYRRMDEFAHIKTVFTIHDIQYQGQFEPGIAEWVLGIGRENLHIVEFDGLVNYLKGAIETADTVSLLSSSRSGDIPEPFYGSGLDGFLREREYKLRSISVETDGDDNWTIPARKYAALYQETLRTSAPRSPGRA